MATSHGSRADVIGNGYVLSTFLNSASFHGTRDSAESTTFKKTSKTHMPGLKDSTMSLGGVYDGDVDAVDQVLSAALSGGPGLFSYVPAGVEVFGTPAYSLDAIETSYEVNSGIGAVNQISAAVSAGDQGVFDRGVVMHSMVQENAAGNTASYDGVSVSTPNGISLILHVLNAVNLVANVQDSADNVTFADLPGTITVANGRSSQRLFVPGTVRRYTRVRWTGTGQFVAILNRK